MSSAICLALGLVAANERLVTLEREQRELRKTVAALRDQLKQSTPEKAS
jgi:hypothetical protein